MNSRLCHTDNCSTVILYTIGRCIRATHLLVLVVKRISHKPLYILGGCPFNGPLSGTKYPTRAASPIQNASTPKSSLPFSKHRSCVLLCAGFSRTLHRVSYKFRLFLTKQVTRATHVRNRVCPRVELILKS